MAAGQRKRRTFLPQGDHAPREIDKDKKPQFKLYDEYEEILEKEGDSWFLHGFFGDKEYWIPVRKKYRFGAANARYRLLLKAERDKSDPNTGQIFPGDNRAAQFSEGRFDTQDMFTVRGIYRSTAFKVGRIWDMDTAEAEAKEQHYQTMKALLLGDEDFKERLLAEVAAEDGAEA